MSEIQRNAWKAMQRGTLIGKVIDQTTNSPIEEVTLKIATRSYTTQKDGIFYFEHLKEGKNKLLIDANMGYIPIEVMIKKGQLQQGFAVKLTAETLNASPVAPVYEKDGLLLTHTDSTYVVLKDVSEKDIPEGCYLRVRKTKNGQTTLLQTDKYSVGNKIVTERFMVDEARIPEGVKENDILHFSANQFSVTEHTPQSISYEKLKHLIGDQKIAAKRKFIPVFADTNIQYL